VDAAYGDAVLNDCQESWSTVIAFEQSSNVPSDTLDPGLLATPESKPKSAIHLERSGQRHVGSDAKSAVAVSAITMLPSVVKAGMWRSCAVSPNVTSAEAAVTVARLLAREESKRNLVLGIPPRTAWSPTAGAHV